MELIERLLGYASAGAGKVAARRAWESEGYIESALSAAEAGMWMEAAADLLRDDDLNLDLE